MHAPARPTISAPGPWTGARRIGFRFGFLCALLLIAPFPLGWLPGTHWVPVVWLELWDMGVRWFATAILGIPAPVLAFTGSGDTTWHYVQLLLIGVLAGLGTVTWSVLDRKHRSYSRLASALTVYLRYWLAFFLVLYGVLKIWYLQMSELTLGQLDQRVGDKSPMGMLWLFMSASKPYTMATGFVEALAGVLLVWRRTTMLGALLAIAAMTNVFVLNLCYDVPVKLFSLELLLGAVAVAAPGGHRLLRAALGHAVAEVPPRTRASARIEQLRRVAKRGLVVLLALPLVVMVRQDPRYRQHHHELHGIWVVERFVADGVELPPLLSLGARWRKLLLGPDALTIRAMTDRRTSYRARVVPERGTIEVIVGGVPTSWRYRRLDANDRTRLVIDGQLRGARLHVELVQEPPPLLLTRGFHWIQEAPFHR